MLRIQLKKKQNPKVAKLENVYEEAYEYFISGGMIENMSYNDAYYVQQMINYIEELRRR
jgi:hypothetical protein